MPMLAADKEAGPGGRGVAGEDAQPSPDADEGVEKYLLLAPPPWKRALDMVGAAVGLAVLFPLFLLIMLYIRLVSPGPVFFRQQRVGHLGKPFEVWKFRTMRLEGDAGLHERHVQDLIRDGKPLSKLDDDADPRILPGGHFLRLTGLDELPQLINVLRGEMSLIGPRPDVPYAVDEYMPWNKMRFDAVPGLTGLWQVSGKNRTTHDQMMRLDIRYGRTRDPRRDAAILARTPLAIVAQIKDYFSRRSRRS
jgi:lipopolysaccharide/colanic/teichoic acid biosynthesis glycosyltransferase